MGLRALILALLVSCGSEGDYLQVLPDGTCQQVGADGKNRGTPFACPAKSEIPIRR